MQMIPSCITRPSPGYSHTLDELQTTFTNVKLVLISRLDNRLSYTTKYIFIPNSHTLMPHLPTLTHNPIILQLLSVRALSETLERTTCEDQQQFPLLKTHFYLTLPDDALRELLTFYLSVTSTIDAKQFLCQQHHKGHCFYLVQYYLYYLQPQLIIQMCTITGKL